MEIIIDARPALMQTDDAGGREPVGERRPGVIHGLGNIIENAVDFARSRVEITARWNEREVSIIVADDGPGFSPEILDTIGEPYITTRSRPSPRSSGAKVPGAGGITASPLTPHAGGLGLGFFIAKTLLERSGATISFGNRTGGSHGAVIRVAWARQTFEGPVNLWGAPRAIPSGPPADARN